MSQPTKLDDSKVILIEAVMNSIDNGFIDEDVTTELEACLQVAKTIKHPFEKHLLVQQLNEMIAERDC